MNLKGFNPGQSTSAGLECKGTSKGIRFGMGTTHGDITRDSIDGLVGSGKAADNGIPIIGGRVVYAIENKGGIREVAGRGGGTKVKEL